MASSGADEPHASWPRPCSPPSRPGEAARAEEARRAVLAQARGASLTISAVPTLLADDALGLLVVHKPAGVYVDDVSRVVVGAFASQTRPRVTMLHRLDRDTSGCLAFATRPQSNRSFSSAFRDGAAEKTYVCEISTPHDGTEDELREWRRLLRAADLPRRVRTGHGRSAHGLWRVYPASDVGASLPSTSTKKTGNRVQLAETRVAAVTRDRYAFIRLDTGRTHQIRLHMAHLGWPLAGDVKYGGALVHGSGSGEEKTAAEESVVRLHAARLRLPRGGDDDRGDEARFVEIEAPKPAWFEEASDGEYARALGEAVGVVEREATFRRTDGAAAAGSGLSRKE